MLFEDSAALLGLAIAAAGVWASHATGDARIDGMASVAIGTVLAAVAVLLAREAKGLLIGESADSALVATIWRLLERRPEITSVNHVRTIHTAPDAVFVAVSADFDDSIAMGVAETLIEVMEAELKAADARSVRSISGPKREAMRWFLSRPWQHRSRPSEKSAGPSPFNATCALQHALDGW